MYNLLIAEDEPLVIEYLMNILDWEQHGFRIKAVARNGEEGLQRLKEGTYHLVISDIKMPEMDGLAFIKHAKNQYPLLKYIIISGYGDFSYAKQAVAYGVKGYLLKPVDKAELTEQITMIRHEFDTLYQDQAWRRETQLAARTNFLFRLTCGEVPQHEINRKSVLFGLDALTVPDGKHLVGLIEFTNYQHIVNRSLHDARVIQYGLCNILQEYLQRYNLGIVYEDPDNALGMILSSSRLHSEAVSECMRQACTTMFQYYGAKLAVGFGLPVDTPDQLVHSKKQAQQALDRRPAWKEESFMLLFYGQQEDLARMEIGLVWDYELLLKAIEEGNIIEIEREIMKLSTELQVKQAQESLRQGMMYSIRYGLQRLVRKHQGNTNHQQDWLRTVDWTASSGWERMLISCCREVSSVILHQLEDRSADVVVRIKDYIEKHYHEDLTLKMMAGIFYMNPAYLGRLFRKETGVHFNDYVHKIRIDNVKRMVLRDQGKILDILHEAGYVNSKYFYQIFKRLEGMTFQQYKLGIKQLKETGRHKV
ncbi:hypothetical protein SY83_09270 [Paenibacillus swuensis]|uniref:AraC family transcriptional regulator n=1 Tax=Paenibacillus swuensis TaxID=1178515 RepID=A0A172THB2_9BACL|nr:response regulator [Paenibacillus swuensis]ANE46431.1 hypothetical protein SY83_09270 [Paenibacillus swuensis]